MPQIIQSGSLNTTALIVPDLYVQIVPPQNLLLNGVPSNVIGVVGTASWGPLNKASLVGNGSDYFKQFGPVMNRTFDMGTQVATAILQGAANFRCVRVSDGTEAAASFVIPTTAMTLTALYPGTLGNTISVAVSAGSKSGTWAISVGIPGMPAELFDNIAGSGNAFWLAAASAINNGTGVNRGPSQFVAATAGAGTTAAAAATYALSGGTDGVASITTTTLIGVDTVPRKGMYALRGQGCGLGLLADGTDPTQWTVQASYGLSEGTYMIATAAAGIAVANGTTGTVDVKATAGLDSYAVKVMHGDWLYWNDPVNNVVRLVSPQGFVAGVLGNMSPEQSSLNKPIFGVVGSQKSGVVGSAQINAYSEAELSTLIQNGIDVICRPQPGGNYWGCRAGHNSSSDSGKYGDNYARLTNYLSQTLGAGMGKYVGRVVNDGLFNAIRSTLLTFLASLLSQGILGRVGGVLPYSVTCDATNNPPERTALGYVQADVQVRYQAINEKFIINLEGGQTVSVNRQTLPPSNVPSTPVF